MLSEPKNGQKSAQGLSEMVIVSSKISPRSYLKHLEDLVLIINILYPHREVVLGKYERMILRQDWSEDLNLLIVNLIKSLAIINQKYRVQDDWCRIWANKEDWITALFLVERSIPAAKAEILLSQAARYFYSRLLHEFHDNWFTARQAMFVNHLSKTNTRWKLLELWSKGFVQIDKSKRTHYYKICRFPYKKQTAKSQYE